MLLEVAGWTIKWNKEEHLWHVYPPEEVNRSCNFYCFSSDREAIEFVYTRISETE